MSYSYPLYGLSVVSDTPIPGLCRKPTGVESADILLEVTSDPPDWVQAARNLPSVRRHNRLEHEEAGDPACSVTSLGPDEFLELSYSDGTQFVIDAAGARVWGTCLLPLTIEDFADYFRGPVMGLVLRLRNIIALHASVVNLWGAAVLLCGESAAGKSTTAAALALRGIPVLTEDIAALCVENRRFQVQAGHPRICLWRDSVANLFGTAEALSQVSAAWEKCYLPLDGKLAKFDSKRRPVGAIYLLGQRTAAADTPRIEEVSAPAALLELVRNTYRNWLLDRTQRAAEFEVLGKLVTQVPVRRIVPHFDPARIEALCDLIVADTSALRNAAAPSLVSNR